MSYYLFHITDVEDTVKVYKFDTNNLILIFKYIMEKWWKNYLKFIKYTWIDTHISSSIPNDIFNYINDETSKSDMFDMIYKIDTQDLLKLFRVRFCSSNKFLIADKRSDRGILSNGILNTDYIYLQKIETKNTDNFVSLHCEYDLKDNCRCESLNFDEITEYCNTTNFDMEFYDIVYPISDIETISTYSNTDPDIKERIQFIEKFQDFLTRYESNNVIEFEFY